MSDVFEREDSMRIWEKELRAESEARGEAHGREARSREIYEK